MEVYDMIELQNMEIEVVTDPKEISAEANELESIIFDLIVFCKNNANVLKQ